MLILSRKPGQGLIIQTPSGPIVIKSLTAGRIGVEAPRGMEIMREELQTERQ